MRYDQTARITLKTARHVSVYSQMFIYLKPHSEAGDEKTKGHAVYTIDLAAILQLLRDFRRSGMLRAEVSAGLARLKKPCVVILELQHGEVVSCHVKDTKGQTLLSGQEAFRAVDAAGTLTWIFDAHEGQNATGRQTGVLNWPGGTSRNNSGWLQTPPALPVPPRPSNPVLPVPPRSSNPTLPVPQHPANPAPYSLIPRRLLELHPARISGWPRRHWQVYLLVDGTRCVEQIATMLSQPPQIVEQVLREIQATGAITLV
jgi:hypothetical protein